MNSKSPWSTYGRMPPQSQQQQQAASSEDVTLGAMNDLARGREQLDKYLSNLMREYYEIRSGQTGYRKIVDDVLSPSDVPETIEERLTRLAREAAARRSGGSERPPSA
jgi:hypothetical protein